MCLDICDLLPVTKAGQNLEFQLSKSGTAPALIYGEAQAAESSADFIHKMNCLQVLRRHNVLVLDIQLIASIFVANSVASAANLIAGTSVG